MKYRRLNTEFVSTDPFTGLFLAAFGNQGPELLQLQRQVDSEDVSSSSSLCACCKWVVASCSAKWTFKDVSFSLVRLL